MSGGGERLRYDEIAELDMTAVEGLSEEQLQRHFQGLAAAATAGQLRRFLELIGEGEDDETDKPVLAAIYVGRRVDKVLALRRARADFDKALSDLGID